MIFKLRVCVVLILVNNNNPWFYHNKNVQHYSPLPQQWHLWKLYKQQLFLLILIIPLIILLIIKDILSCKLIIIIIFIFIFYLVAFYAPILRENEWVNMKVNIPQWKWYKETTEKLLEFLSVQNYTKWTTIASNKTLSIFQRFDAINMENLVLPVS